MHHSVLRRTALGLAVALSMGLTSASFAADVNGRIKGTVTDPQDAVVPGVTVTATNQATGVHFSVKTSADGSYLFPELPVGTYSISVAAPGFKSFRATGIVINIDQEYVEPVKLGVGDTSETLEVAADAVQVNTTDMQLNNIVNSTQMIELPLIGRNFTGLELIEPGVQSSSDRFGTSSVSGAQSQQSEYLINGADSNDIALNTLVIVPNLDAIDEFNLIDGPLNAEYDRNSGGIVTATIKQGTNHFHGDAFEFYRDTFLNTRNYFQLKPSKYHQNIFGGTLGGPIFKDKLFFFGAYQGIRQTVPQAGGTAYVYSPANLAGNFTEDFNPNKKKTTSNPLGYNFSNNPVPSSIAPALGCTAEETWSKCLNSQATPGVVPTSAFNPVSLALVKAYVPAPNSGTFGYSFNPVTATSQNQEIARVDYALNQRNQFTILNIYQKSNVNDTLPFTGATVPGFGDVNTQTTNQYTVDYVHQFSSTLVNDFALHYTRFDYQAVIPQKPTLPSSAGFDITPENTAGAGLPSLAVGSNFTLGFSRNGPQPRVDQVYQIDDNVSKTFGQHTLKFGYDGRRFNVSNPFNAVNNGSYGFSTNNNTSPYNSGDPTLDFLLGVPGSFSQGSGADIQAQAFLNYFYAQDTWKLTDALTLDFGLGYQIDTPLQQHQYGGEGVACFIPGQQSTVFPTAPKGINYPGDPGCTSSAQAYTRYNELGPRIGFAWSPDLGVLSAGNAHKFAIRGGFGIYYDRTEEETSLQTLETPPFGLSSSGIGDNGGHPQLINPFADINGGYTPGCAAGLTVGGSACTAGTASIPNKFPFAFPTKGQKVDFGPSEPLGISTYDPNFRSPYAENVQLSVEREFPSRIVARASYVGSFARHNQVTYEGNAITPAGHAACLAGNEFSPVLGSTTSCPDNASLENYYFPQNTLAGAIDPTTGNVGILSVGEVSSLAASSYNSIQIGVQKASTHGLNFQLSYTFSHALDNGSSFENSGFGGSVRGYNQYDQALNYGDSAFDARHRFVFAPIYITPIISSSAWYSPRNLALSGWELSGILTLATGFPFDISYGGASAYSLWCGSTFYACPDVPNQVGPTTFNRNPRNLQRQGITSPLKYFSTSNYVDETLGSFGNVHRNPFHGPGINNTNVVVAKDFNLSADGVRRLQLRMENDNVFNHANFSNPDGNFNDGTFGQITSTNTNLSPRDTQLGVRFLF